MGLYQGTDPALIGQIVPAARTFSMSQAVGTIDPGYDATGPGAGEHPQRRPEPVGQRPLAEQPDHSPPEFALVNVRQGSPMFAVRDLPCSGCWWTKMQGPQ